MHIGLVLNDRTTRGSSNSELVRCLCQRKIDYRLVLPDHTTIYTHGTKAEIRTDDGVLKKKSIIVNCLGGSSNKGLVLLHCLEDLGYRVVNKATPWRYSKIKPLTSALLTANTIPHPDGVFGVGWPKWATDYAASKLLGALVKKPWRGSKGRGISYIPTRTKLSQLVGRTGLRDAYIYLQTYIKNSGRHIRVIVIGGQVIAAIYRVHRKGQFITGAHLGFGKPVVCPLTDEIVDLSLRATKCIGLDIAGVDLIEDSKGLYVLELNSWPGGHLDFQRATGISIAESIVAYLVKEFDDKG